MYTKKYFSGYFFGIFSQKARTSGRGCSKEHLWISYSF